MSPNRNRLKRGLLASASVLLLLPAARVAGAQAVPAPSALTNPAGSAQDSANKAAADSAKPLTPDQLDALIAPIALYPDDLLMQTLVAATYPLELIQLSQWLAKHPDLKDKALADSVAKQPWDPSIQTMAAIPEVVKRLSDDIQWTTDLGNAFLANQSGVMDAAQRMRKKAKDKGALVSNEQQKVETKVVEKQTVIVVESTNPQVVYVPSYSPTVVYGPAYYPYPPIYYPPYPPGGMMISFGIGMMWGAAMWGGPCCHAGWHGGGNTVIINHNNNFNQINNRPGGVGGAGGAGGGNWSHNAEHRGGAPYGDRATASKYGGSARGDAGGARPSTGMGGAGGAGGGARPSTGMGGAGGAGGTRPSTGMGAGASGGAGSGARPSTGMGAGSASGSTRPSTGASTRGTSSSGFGGGSGGYSGASARGSSSRGSSSMGSRGSMSRGGGGRRR